MTAADVPTLPMPGTVYWVETGILPGPDPEPHRAAVVIAAPLTTGGTVTVVTRSSSDGFGVQHGPDFRLGLSSPGRFSRRVPVQSQLWTPATATALGPLDDATFAAVLDRFRP